MITPMPTDAATTLFQPPYPPIPASDPPRWRKLTALHQNAIEVWPAEVYEKELWVQRFFGNQRLLMNAPAGIEHVLVENAANYRRTPAAIRVLRPLIGHGLFFAEGEDWRLQRHTIAPALSPRAIPILTRHMVGVGQEVIARLETEAKTGRPVNILVEMQLLALDVAGRSMFSIEMHQFGPRMRRMILDFGLKLGRPYLSDMILPTWLPTLLDLRRLLFRARRIRLMESIIAERLKLPASETPRDLFDLLRAARDPETGQGFTPQALRDQVSTMLVAGHETTALTLFWALYLLASVPAVQERLAEEVKDIEITPENAGDVLPRLGYGRAVVSETLRLYPPAFLVVREAIAEDRHAGVRIPPNSLVLIAPWVLHRHRKHWANPDAFDPDRFLEGAPPQRYTYLPFGAGPPVCVGAQFAMAEAVLILAMMVQRFRVSRADSEPVLPVAVITTHPSRPAPFRLQVR